MTTETCRFEIGPGRVVSQLTLEDVPALFALTDENRDYLRQWLPWVDGVKEQAHSGAFVTEMLAKHEKGGLYTCAIRVREEMAGVIGHHLIDRSNRVTHLGYWLGERWQGQGLMTRAVSAFVLQAFEDLELNRVEIACATGNRKSCAIPERLGFTYEGTLRQSEWLYDHYVDLRLYALLRSEWEA